MAYFPVNRNANQANTVMELKSVAIRFKNLIEQMKRETDGMDEATMQSQYGVTATLVQWSAVVDGMVPLASDASLITYISSVG